jgi:hypothetical protein
MISVINRASGLTEKFMSKVSGSRSPDLYLIYRSGDQTRSSFFPLRSIVCLELLEGALAASQIGFDASNLLWKDDTAKHMNLVTSTKVTGVPRTLLKCTLNPKP